MVDVKALKMWSISISMLGGKSPKIKYLCGKCGSYNTTRISLDAVNAGNPYVVCAYCGEINNTRLTLG
ncbi:peptidoglycan-binding protein [Clostridium botulinum]|uniref:peptidoglycan-binding protein n=1 Tax=Clostridium botulinum TaxID=1491 RepID=UPI00099D40F3|nr:peptidoglycan-binding protein [Clostridium botulinum]OPD28836.1 peptidoglycan-binding protein [Clostridium botulinum]